LGLGKNTFNWVDGLGRVGVINNKRIAEANVVRRWLQALGVKWLQGDFAIFYRCVNVFV